LDSEEFELKDTWTVGASQANMRLDEFICFASPLLFTSATAAKKTIRKGLVKLNQEACEATDRLVQAGDRVSSYVRSRPGNSFINQKQGSAVDVNVTTMYEDDFLAIVCKPQGVPVFPVPSVLKNGFNMQSIVLNQNVLSPISDSVREPLRRPQPAHRLDIGTGGLLLFAKTRPALIALSALFSSRSSDLEKKYLALCAGRFEGSSAGSITLPLGGKEAHTDYVVRRVDPVRQELFDGWVSTVELTLHTGRTHQIRRHLDAIGHPILGDEDYWFEQAAKSGGNAQPHPRLREVCLHTTWPICLWATSMKFLHPLIPGQFVEAQLPLEPVLFTEIREALL